MPIDRIQALLRGLVRDAVTEAHAEVVHLGADHFFGHFQYPKMTLFRESGMPNFSTVVSGPKQYSDAIGPAGGVGTRIDQDILPRYGQLRAFIRSTPLLREIVLGDASDREELNDSLLEFTAKRLVGSVLERLMHLNLEPTLEVIDDLYLPLEKGIFDEERPVDVLIPLLCVTCDVDEVQIADDVQFIRMDEGTQLSRMTLSHFGPVQDVLIGAATHALVISGGISRRMPFLMRPSDELPLKKAEYALRALRIASGRVFGYAQTIVRPIGWARSYTTTLPPLAYATVERRYPPSLDAYGWLKPSEKLSEGALEEAAEIYANLKSAPARIQQAVRRIDRAQMRDDADDLVVDYCIALESLLDDNTQTETTHKCALRAATVLAQTENWHGPNVFEVVKKAYSLRSKIVHGHPEKHIKKLRTVAIGDTQVATAEAIRIILHRLVVAMLHRPEWQSPRQIDLAMLTAVPRGGDSTTTDDDADPTPM